jgi:hypothetical protein
MRTLPFLPRPRLERWVVFILPKSTLLRPGHLLYFTPHLTPSTGFVARLEIKVLANKSTAFSFGGSLAVLIFIMPLKFA